MIIRFSSLILGLMKHLSWPRVVYSFVIRICGVIIRRIRRMAVLSSSVHHEEPTQESQEDKTSDGTDNPAYDGTHLSVRNIIGI